MEWNQEKRRTEERIKKKVKKQKAKNAVYSANLQDYVQGG